MVGDHQLQRRYHDELRNTVYYLLPQRKKNKFKAYGVKAVVPRMLMVHHKDVCCGDEHPFADCLVGDPKTL
jgi:hypothetical protein